VFDDSIEFIAYSESFKAERKLALAKAEASTVGSEVGSTVVLPLVLYPSREDVVTDREPYERAVEVMNPTRCLTRSVLKGAVLLWTLVLFFPLSLLLRSLFLARHLILILPSFLFSLPFSHLFSHPPSPLYFLPPSPHLSLPPSPLPFSSVSEVHYRVKESDSLESLCAAALQKV
jgi:hypothetical protein